MNYSDYAHYWFIIIYNINIHMDCESCYNNDLLQIGRLTKHTEN